MSAFGFAGLALARQAVEAQALLFADLPQRAVAPHVLRIETAGRDEPGEGAASYVAGPLATEALLADHPRFVARTLNGRIFRLAPAADGSITVEQGGALGQAGHNDQPAIQATLAYAEAVGATTVRFGKAHYELWATIRTSPRLDTYAEDGFYLSVHRSMTLEGMAGRRTVLDFRGLAGTDPEQSWQLIDHSATDATQEPWRGGAIRVFGEPAADPEPAERRVGRFAMRNLHLKGKCSKTARAGTWPADPDTGEGWDVSHKGLWIQDCWMGEIALTDCDITGFRGELYYVSGFNLPVLGQTLERCRFATTDGAAFNPGTTGPLLARDCSFGDAYLAEESAGSHDARYVNCVWHDAASVVLGGGPLADLPAGMPHVYATRDEGSAPPRMHIEGGEFRAIDTVMLGSWVRGRFRTTDASVQLAATLWGLLSDCVLDIEAWLDQRHGIVPVLIGGPASETTQLNNAPAGTYVQPPANCHVTLSCHRTQLAAENDRHWFHPEWSGLLRPSCSLTVREAELAIDRPPQAVETVPKSWPLVRVGTLVNTQGFGAPTSRWHGELSQSGPFVPSSTHCAVAVASGTTADLTLPTGNAGGAGYGYADGQEIVLYKRGDAGAARFVRGADASFVVPQTRVLASNTDHIAFRWNEWANRWEEARFWSSAAA